MVRGNPIGGFRNGQKIKYSEFIKKLQDGDLKTGTVERIRAKGTLKTGAEFSVELSPSDRAQGELIDRLTAAVVAGKLESVETPSPFPSEMLQNVFVSVLIPLG